MSDDNTKMITEEHTAVAAPLCRLFNNLGMVPGFYNDEEVAFVCRFDDLEGTDEKAITPLFIVLTAEMHKRCLNAVGEKPEELEGKVKKHSVKILWGSKTSMAVDGDGRESIDYEFDTTAELSAFLHGVDEANGWLDYELVEEEEPCQEQ